jgi:hypothetical protein
MTFRSVRLVEELGGGLTFYKSLEGPKTRVSRRSSEIYSNKGLDVSISAGLPTRRPYRQSASRNRRSPEAIRIPGDPKRGHRYGQT